MFEAAEAGAEPPNEQGLSGIHLKR